MHKLQFVLICCFITGILCGCSGGGCKKSSSCSGKGCSRGGSSGSGSSSSGCSSGSCGSSSSGSSGSGCSSGSCGSLGSGSSGSGCSSGSCGSSSSGSSGSDCSSGSCGSSDSGSSSSGCSSGSCGSSSSGCSCAPTNTMCSVSYSGAGGHVDVDYDTVPLPSASLPIGIMDSPYYDCTAQSLYWVDLFGGSIFRYSEEINQIFYAQIPGYPGISFILPARNEPNTFVIGVENALYKIMWDGMNTTASVIGKITSAEDGTNHHTNAAVAGPKGAIYWGNFGPKLCGEDQNKGSFRWSRKGGKEQMPGMHKTSNSLTYDYKRGIFYHMDGCTQEITATDICRRTGKYSPFRMVFNQFCLPQYAAPVGISVGSDGSLWVGSYLNGTLFNIDPDKGKIINTYTMPTRLMGASTFGGCNYDKLYVLTSQLEVDVTNGNVISDGKTNPPPDPAGSLMIIHGLGKGRPLRKPCIGC